MKLTCLVLHTHSRMDKVIRYIEKHPLLELMRIEYDMANVTCRTFPKEIQPDLCFIDRSKFEMYFTQIHTLIQVSGYLAVMGEEAFPENCIEKDNLRYLAYKCTYKDFSQWLSRIKSHYSYALLHSPDFGVKLTHLSCLKKTKLEPIVKNKIVIIWVNNGICHVGLEDRTILCNNSLSEFYTLFRSEDFIQVREDVIINDEHIEGLHLDVLKLTNGMSVLLGFKFRRRFFYHVKPAFCDSPEGLKFWEDFFNSADEDHNAKVRNEP